MTNDLTAEKVHLLLSYDPATGNLIWKSRRGGKRPAGTVAGYLTERGYIGISLLGKQYKVHRVIWLMHTGSWPVHEIDHINGIRSDNRLPNLRDIPRELNMQNSRPDRANKTGYTGVHAHKKKFSAEIRAHGKRYRLGLFPTAELAHQAYIAAKQQLHQGCARWAESAPPQPATNPASTCEASLCMQSNKCSYAPCRSGAPPQPAKQPSAARGEVVVTWDKDRTRILAVTRQDDEGQILSVIADVPSASPAATVAQGLTDEQRNELELIERCDPSWVIFHLKENTVFDITVIEKAFALAKEHARVILARATPRAQGGE